MRDTIRLTGIEVMAAHGPLPEERETERRFIVDLLVSEDVDNAAIIDQMIETIWYEDLVDDVVTEMTAEPTRFLETLALRIANRILDRGASSVEVTVHKPDFQAAVHVGDAAITVRRVNPLYDDELGIRHVVLRASSHADNAEEILDRIPQELAGLDLYVVGMSNSYHSVDNLGRAEKSRATRAVIIRTAMSPAELQKKLRHLEVRLGRSGSSRLFGHTIEISIMTFGTLRAVSPKLKIPHPQIMEDTAFLNAWVSFDAAARIDGVEVSRILDDSAHKTIEDA